MGIFSKDIEQLRESSCEDYVIMNEEMKIIYEEAGSVVLEAVLEDWKFNKKDFGDKAKIEAFCKRVNKEAKDPSVKDVVWDTILAMGIVLISFVPAFIAIPFGGIGAVYALEGVGIILSYAGATYVNKRYDRLKGRINKAIAKLEKEKVKRTDEKVKKDIDLRIKELKNSMAILEREKKKAYGLDD